jgi:acyl phosphate:glycerol-3-phosphate acyltransferase
MLLSIVVSALGGWLVGTFPVAYLVVRRVSGVDLAREGSTNVGANNALRTTGSKRMGLVVLALDAVKGVAAAVLGALVATSLGGPGPEAMAAAVLGAIAGHNYNLVLSLMSGRLAGGKGLAAAAGGFLLVMPWLVGAWVALFVVGMEGYARWRGVRDSIPGNVFATALVPPIGWALYGVSGLLAMVAFALLVLPRHVHQMRELWMSPHLVEVRQQEGVKPADSL